MNEEREPILREVAFIAKKAGSSEEIPISAWLRVAPETWEVWIAEAKEQAIAEFRAEYKADLVELWEAAKAFLLEYRRHTIPAITTTEEAAKRLRKILDRFVKP